MHEMLRAITAVVFLVVVIVIAVSVYIYIYIDSYSSVTAVLLQDYSSNIP